MIAIKSEKDINAAIESFKRNGQKQELEDYLKSQLNANQADRLERILHDEKALNEVLNSPKAKALLRKLTGENNG